ncbi:pilus assembly protein PilM [Candidatus Saccharibacteria bacterium]|jgi:type IV pilus assembly protein PilM|nr:pilus assembly protein PilM [Candidatus Saccharibacteria bacterium]
MAEQLFYKNVPIFGIDIGFGTVKVVNLLTDTANASNPLLLGYGVGVFDSSAVEAGIIVKPSTVAESIYKLISKQMTGYVATKSIAVTIPISQSFVRTIEIPDVKESELDDAVKFEIEQSVPLPMAELYLDYEVTNTDHGTGIYEVLTVAISQKIVDSYLRLFELLDLDPILVEPSMSAIARAVNHDYKLDRPVLILDMGSHQADLSIYDKTIRVTATAVNGSDDITIAIAKTLKITRRQAFMVKTKYGIKQDSKYYQQIKVPIDVVLSPLIGEINKIVRYYRLRSNLIIKDIIVVGGGSSFPGFPDYIAEQTKLAITLYDPWRLIQPNGLQSPHALERPLFTTAIGSALAGLEKKHD